MKKGIVQSTAIFTLICFVLLKHILDIKYDRGIIIVQYLEKRIFKQQKQKQNRTKQKKVQKNKKLQKSNNRKILLVFRNKTKKLN
jgi:hypothetical protein